MSVTTRTPWRQARKDEPCAQCGKSDRHSIAPDGGASHCHRCEVTHRKGNGNGNGYGTGYIGKAHRPKPSPTSAPLARQDWAALDERLRAAMTDERLAALAEATGIPAAAWAELGPGWASADELRAMRASGAGWTDAYPEGAWTFAERSGDGRIMGLSLRATDGRKGAPAGSGRGLVVPATLHKLPDPALVVEGASDVAACVALGLAAVGRPSNRGGADDLAVLLDGRIALVVGERDGKPGGAWPGRDGAKAVAQRLAAAWGEVQRWTLPPVNAKDVREWLSQRRAAGLVVTDGDVVQAARAELLAALEQSAKELKAERRTQADSLVDLAREQYRLGMSEDGEAFAVPVDGPAVATMFRGGGLRTALAKAYRTRTGKTPNASALADALVALEGIAQDSVPEPVALRVASHDDGVVLDLADSTGRVVVVTPGEWAVQAVSPVLFRRTALSAPLPEPAEAEPVVLLELRSLLNVDDDTWPLVVGWLVAALLPGIPHPVLLLDGEQGTGKSSAARLLVGIIDPSTAPLRSDPRDPEQWAIAASGSWVVCIDNVSHISGWLSDAICKAVTGDGLVRRKLYTDSDLAVLSFRRCIILTSIDAGAMRGDLGDRLLLADLERIGDDKRRTEAELEEAYRAFRPRLMGALLSAVARTLAVLPAVRLQRMPRMADFARVLAALDLACPELTKGRALELFAGQRGRIAGEVVESDAVAMAVVRLMEGRDTWRGTAGELLAALEHDMPAPRAKGWPCNARALAGRMKRLRPALLGVGIRHDAPAAADKTRTHRIERRGDVPPTPPEPPGHADSGVRDGTLDRLDAGGVAVPPAERPPTAQVESGVFDPTTPDSGGVGGMGGPQPLTYNRRETVPRLPASGDPAVAGG